MIRVLIVEDDKFARQGIKNSLPWKEHHMEVTGEASNGKAALGIIRSQEIDLVLSDYSMPGMDGLHLLKEVKEEFPWITFCMITLYEDFDIIQKAMRYGAADYISKLQLEEENFEQVLSHLENRVKKEKESKEKRIKAPAVLTCPENECFILSCITNQTTDFLTDKSPEFFLHKPMEVENNIYAYYPSGKQEENGKRERESFFEALAKPWYGIWIDGLEGCEQNHFFKIVRRYYRYDMFYNHRKERISFEKLERKVEEIPTITEESIFMLEKEWTRAEWLYDNGVFREMLTKLRESRLPFNVLFRLLVKIEDSVSQKYGVIFKNTKLSLPYTFYSWEDAGMWLTALSQRALADMKSRQLTPEVMESMVKAMNIVKEEISSPLLAFDVADRVNLSRSYFSLCFKKVTDMSFNQFVREKKIDIAREYLEKTEMTIQQVAECTGYEDEKYFSKVFARETGALPSRYRKEKRSGSLAVI